MIAKAKKAKAKKTATKVAKKKAVKNVGTPAGKPISKTAPKARRNKEIWVMRLYVAGNTERSLDAIANLKDICEKHLRGQYKIEVIDLVRNPKLARGDQILAVPTLVRKLPGPVKRIIGNLSNSEQVLVGLDIRPERS